MKASGENYTVTFEEKYPAVDNLPVALFLFVVACVIWGAYARSIPGLNASHGIIPDIPRSLLPTGGCSGSIAYRA